VSTQSAAGWTFIQSWNGHDLSTVASPSKSSYNRLTAVSCVSPTSCEALGANRLPNSTTSVTLAELWNGDTWTVTSSPDHLSSINSVSSVSCVQVKSCEVVGYYHIANNFEPYQALVESYG
jgi:hypothetical protein